MKNLIQEWGLLYLKNVMALLLLLSIMACSNEDNDAPQITLGQLTSVYEGTCNHSSGITGADYEISIPYSGTDNNGLSRMFITVTPEGGPTNEANSNFNDFDLTDGSGTLTWNGCLLYLDADWIDFEVRIETTDGAVSSSSSIRLNRTDSDSENPETDLPFVITWIVGDSSYGDGELTITIPTNPLFMDYLYTVDWGDGNVSMDLTGDVGHTYASAGTYTVSISGDFPSLHMISGGFGNQEKLLSVQQWGDISWGTMKWAFYGCSNLSFNTIDVPDLSKVTDMSEMFSNATGFNEDLNSWDVSNVTKMAYMFNDAHAFNGDVSGWDVSNVTDMSGMFSEATAFNQDIGSWNVGQVTNMESMFNFADAFNQDIGLWNVVNVERMRNLFFQSRSFNQDISEWKVDSTTLMDGMFDGAIIFNQDIGSWNVGKVTDMATMFRDALSFNQDISAWDVSNVTDMEAMLNNAQSFSQDLSGWNTINVTKCSVFAEDSAMSPGGLPILGPCDFGF
ncbi:MAG: BspA family leucine-rich repeat surface protein [Saonia sp.]